MPWALSKLSSLAAYKLGSLIMPVIAKDSGLAADCCIGQRHHVCMGISDI